MNLLRYLTRFSGQPTSGRRSRRCRARLSVEALESRVTPSVLTVNGNASPNAANIITLDVNSGGGIQLTLDYKVSEFSAGEWSSVVVNPGGGNNARFSERVASQRPSDDQQRLGATDSIQVGNGNLSSLASGVTINGNGKDLCWRAGSSG